MITNELRDNNWCYDRNFYQKDKTRKFNLIDFDNSLYNASNIIFHLQKEENEFYI